jgi:protein TonB
MANQSIYSEQWIDLVFENRNKEYGAYQLRYENPKTTLKALGIGFMLVAFLLSISMFLNKSESGTAAVVEFLPIHPIPMSSLIFPPEKKSDLEAAPLIQKKNDKPKPEVSKSNLVDPKVTETQNAKTEIATNDEALETYVEPIQGALAGTENSGVKGGIGNAPTADASATNGSDNGTHVTAVLDKQPAFPGGMKKFYAYVAQNFKTPQAELAKTVKVYVSFVIEKEGTMTNIEVLQNPGYGLDLEAIRVLKSLKTKWTPGILKGKPVRTSYNLPIVIQQQN